MAECSEGRWLLLIHQLPPKPAYLRVKVWRRLQSLGAVAIKNTVYVIPKTDGTLEDFQWVAREIVEDGGEATICAASFIEGLLDDQVEAQLLGHPAAKLDHFAELPRRVDVEQREGRLRRMERFHGEAQHHRAILST